jgi:hypothetical protein
MFFLSSEEGARSWEPEEVVAGELVIVLVVVLVLEWAPYLPASELYPAIQSFGRARLPKNPGSIAKASA